jgi:hypothetical protein
LPLLDEPHPAVFPLVSKKADVGPRVFVGDGRYFFAYSRAAKMCIIMNRGLRE